MPSHPSRQESRCAPNGYWRGPSLNHWHQTQNHEKRWKFLQCAGQQADCESAVHAMPHIFAKEETDAVFLVDANALCYVNRKVMLHDIQYISSHCNLRIQQLRHTMSPLRSRWKRNSVTGQVNAIPSPSVCYCYCNYTSV